MVKLQGVGSHKKKKRSQNDEMKNEKMKTKLHKGNAK